MITIEEFLKRECAQVGLTYQFLQDGKVVFGVHLELILKTEDPRGAILNGLRQRGLTELAAKFDAEIASNYCFYETIGPMGYLIVKVTRNVKGYQPIPFLDGIQRERDAEKIANELNHALDITPKEAEEILLSSGILEVGVRQ